MKTNHRNEEARHLLVVRLQRDAAPEWRADLIGCVPALVMLLDESHTRPIESIKASVRDLITERCMTGAGRVTHDPAGLDTHTAIVLDAMARVLRQELRNGEWDATPVPPQMFG